MVETRRGGGRTKGALLGLALGAGLLLAGEGVARLVLDEPPDAPLIVPTGFAPGAPQGWTTSPVHAADPHLIWRNRRNVEVEFEGVHVRLDPLGLRGGPASRARPPGVVRILSLGESTTFGVGVEEDETYSAVLERYLDGLPDAPDVEVLNAGVLGWTLAQSAAWLEREGLALEPDVVVLYHGFNDFIPTSYSARLSRDASPELEAQRLTDLAIMARERSRGAALLDALAERSLALRWVRSFTRPGVSSRAVGADWAPADRSSVRVPEPDRRALLRQVLGLCRGRGVDLLVVVPVYREFAEHRAVLLEFVEATGVPSVDLEDLLPKAAKARRLLFLDPTHPTAALHERFGEAIGRSLEDTVRRRSLASR